MIGDKDHWEADLEQSRDINGLQRYRLYQYWNKVRDNTRPLFDSHKLFFVEEDLREVVQEEMSIKEEHKILNKDAEERLHALNIKYWLLMQTCKMGLYEERLSYGGPILNGICTACLLKIVLTDKDAVLVDVDVVLTVRLIPRIRKTLNPKHNVLDSPFDMIDAPPTYGQIAKDKTSAKKRDKTR
ncbi:hypothetical protein N7449_009982 [Penicillium cf. viridicatum]|uniref:Uncharacterized protein n=1 Tax=Penicillium cf. viridicatum TaxID=2972119 RepID=A0A9W9IXP4_9EURO|nr:hypothetical protein N7449_009982 [Penicillium cf. viridicatum]